MGTVRFSGGGGSKRRAGYAGIRPLKAKQVIPKQVKIVRVFPEDERVIRNLKRFGNVKAPFPDAEKKEKLLLLMGLNDWANVGYRLAEAVNRYSENWGARVIVGNPHKLGYPFDILAVGRNYDMILRLMKKADFILYVGSYYGYTPVGIRPNLKKTKRGIWHGGTAFRTKFKVYNRDIHPLLDAVFAHRDLETLGKGILRLDAPFNTDKYTPRKGRRGNKVVVGHSAHFTAGRKDFFKGTNFLRSAMVNLNRKFGGKINFDLISNLSWQDCLKRKKGNDIFFDQIAGYKIPNGATHGYGLSLVEAASMGAVCLAGSGYDDTPIITVKNDRDIVREIGFLVDHPKKLRELSRKTRKWAVDTHGYKVISDYFTGIIDGVLEKF